MSLDDLQAQLRGALDQQFAALKHQYELSIEEARRDAAAEAEREFNAKLELARAEFHQTRTEWESQLQELVIAARADAEQCAAQAAAVERQEYQQQLQAQLEQRVEQAAAAAQRTAALEQESERRRAQSEIEAAREQAKAEVDAERQRLQQEVEAERQRAQQERDAERQRLQQEIAAARQRLLQEREAERAQAEQAAQHERETARQQLQQERNAERQQVEQERDAERQQVQQEREAERQQLKQLLMAERQKLQQQLAADAERARQEIEALTVRHQAELGAAKQAAATAAAAAAAAATAAAAKTAAPPPTSGSAAGVSPAAFDRVLAAISDLDGTNTLASALDLLLAHSGAVAGRAALFLIDGDRLQAWKSSGIPDADVRTVSSPIAGTDLLARAIQTGRATPSSSGVPAPPFAKLPPDRTGLAVPVMIGGRAVAVLYADSGAKPSPPAFDATIELLARHTSTVVALRTAMRTLDVLRGVPADTPDGQADEQSARRFAKLLVSEIKLYNEPAVRAGRQQRDLRQRLRSEIDRAQRLYEERVPPGLSARSAYFQQELVQTLADGDATLLGSA